MFRKKREPREYEIHGRMLVCPHCHGRLFWFRRALHVTRWMAFWDAEWWGGRSDLNFICANCGNIQWFKRAR
jgi:uncharacterized protein YbaR (Trm112 family)